MTATLVLAALLAAQDTASPPPPDTSRFILPDISVIAERQAGSRFDNPVASTEVRSADAWGRDGTGLDAALRLVPGVIAQSRAGNHDIQLVIRGFGAPGAGDRSNSGTARGVRVLVDGFPETEPDGRTAFDGVDLGAAERIEVIRSNSSSTWGNAAGGVVSISTTPAPGDRNMSGESVIGSYGLQRYLARASATAGGVSLNGTLVRSMFDGWREHSVRAGRRHRPQSAARTDRVHHLGARHQAGSRPRRWTDPPSHLRRGGLLHARAERDRAVPRRAVLLFRRTGPAGGGRARRADLPAGLSVGSAFTWSANKYLEYVVDSVHYGNPSATADYSGNRVVGIPAFTGGALAAWSAVSVPLRLQVGLDASAGYWADDANAVRVPGFAVWSLTLGLSDPVYLGAGMALGGYVGVANLFNRDYVASAFLNPDVVNGVPVAFEPGLPRHALVSLSLTTGGRRIRRP